MKVRATRFGRDDHLSGVLTVPDDLNPAIAVVIPNAGFAPMAGPFRLHVLLAERLAEIGIASLRFDFSGLGDSGLPGAREAAGQRKMNDFKDALDNVEIALGIEHFVAMGLCSGATDSHRIALIDQRVKAVAMIDGVAYPDRLFQLIDLFERVVRSFRIGGYFWRKIFGSSLPAAPEPQAPIIHKPTPRAEFSQQLTSTLQAGIQYLFVFTGARPYNHRRQIYSLFDNNADSERISISMFRECDHTFFLKHDRERLAHTISGWLQSKIL